MDAEEHGPFEDFKLEDFFTLDEIVNCLEFIGMSENLVITLRQLDELKKLPPELQAPWRQFGAYLDSTSLGEVPPEANQGDSGEEPSDDSPPPPGETRADGTAELPPAASAVLTDPATGVQASTATYRASSNYFCCVLTRSGYSPKSRTFNTSYKHAWARCKTWQLSLRHRTMQLYRGRC
jgi:hypothetical protein